MVCGHHVPGGGAARGARNPTCRTGMLGPEVDPPLLQYLQHGPLVLLGRDPAQDRTDRLPVLADDLANLPIANLDFVDERRLPSDLPDHDLIGSIHEALGDVFDEFFQLASAHGPEDPAQPSSRLCNLSLPRRDGPHDRFDLPDAVNNRIRPCTIRPLRIHRVDPPARRLGFHLRRRSR